MGSLRLIASMLVVLDQAKLPKLRVVGSIPIARCNSLKALGHKFTAPESRLCREWVRNLFGERSHARCMLSERLEIEDVHSKIKMKRPRVSPGAVSFLYAARFGSATGFAKVQPQKKQIERNLKRGQTQSFRRHRAWA